MTDGGWLVVGGGPVALALAAARGKNHNGEVLLIRPKPQAARERHYALNENSARFLASLDAMPPVCEVRFFHLHTGNDKKPAARISAADAGLPRLCAIAREEDLMHALQKAVKKTAQVIEDNPWQQCHWDDNGIILTAGKEKKSGNKGESKSYRGRFLAVADGANSPLARLLGVHSARHCFQQTALTATVNAEMDNDCAAQWFDDFDTLALLPLSSSSSVGGIFSLIWSLPNDKAQAIAAAGNLAAEATKRTGIKITAANKTAAYPLVASRRAVRALPNVVFVGDSAATIHPLAGQGLNLGFADAAQLADIKDTADLSPYLRRSQKRADVWHGITRSLCYGIVAQAALFAAARSPFLRSRAARLANLF